MHSRLINFLEGIEIDYYKQSDFRKDFSTNQAILNLLKALK